MRKLRVATVVGTRPELIRLSRLIPLLDEHTEHVFIHTGQNNDPNLKDVFFRDFALRDPDHYLGVDNSSPIRAMAETMVGVERIFIDLKPEAVIVLGDTNSAIALLVARRLGIPTYHLEAGNRSFDSNVPEELNRRMVDHISTFNLPYSEPARRNLLSEGIHPRFISLSGSPIPEIAEHYEDQIESSDVLRSLSQAPGSFFLVSAHRQENVDDADRLKTLMNSLAKLAEVHSAAVIFPMHPRTKLRLSKLDFQPAASVKIIDPLGFFDFVKLQMNSKCVLSDSGTISEESCVFGFPAVTIRDSMERPEALEVGAISMTGLGFDEIQRAIVRQSSRVIEREIPAEYGVRNFSERVLSFVESTASRAAFWTGFRG